MIKVAKCEKCGEIVEYITKGEVHAEGFKVLKPNTTDAATEKHVPVVEVKGNTVKVTVGSTLHPMTEEHLINFVMLETSNGVHRVDLTAKDEPIATFALVDGEKPIAAYEYCNLHGFWMKEL